MNKRETYPPSQAAKPMTGESVERPVQNQRMTQADRTALSDQRMLDAAVELIIERGIHKTTLKDIGERGGYSRGLANYRFGSKEGLLNELFLRFDLRWKNHLHKYTRGLTGIAAVKAAADALRDFLKLEPGRMRAMYLLWYESLGRESDVRSKLAKHHDKYRADAEEWIREGIASGEIDPSINAAQFAVQYCAFTFGLVYQWLVNADALDLDVVFEQYEHNIDRLLRKRKR